MRDERRLLRVQRALEAAPAGNMIERLCAGAAGLLDAPGVAVAVATAEHELLTLDRTEPARALDQLQSDFGEGPAWTAHRSGWSVAVPHLEHDDTWPAFGPAASELGLRAVFAFPLRRGSARVGALTVYRQVAGELTDDQHADAVALARVAFDVVIASHADRPADDRDDLDDLDGMFLGGQGDEASIHQASGMVSVQLGITVSAALSVLRARAFSSDRSLHDVAADVVARRLRLTDPPAL